MIERPPGEERLKTFLGFIKDREYIRSCKDQGVPVRTLDPILQKYRFCNVRRRDDRVSRWLLKHYYPKFWDKTDDVWFLAAIARLINWPPTLEHLLVFAEVIPGKAMLYDQNKFVAALEQHKRDMSGGKIYTGAYMLYAGGRNPKFKGVLKSSFIGKHILPDLWEHREAIKDAIKKHSVRRTVGTLIGCFGLDTFMAGQIAADLTYLDGQLAGAADLCEYAPQGPGSLRGLNRLTGKPLTTTWNQGAWEDELVTLRLAILNELGPTHHGRQNVPLITLHDVQNCLCEFDKYMRVKLGEGQPRSHYRPETAYQV